jgi:signal transduction histidine kinase
VDEAHARRYEDVKPGEFVCLTVSDTGCGMTSSVKAQIFEPFFTTKDTRKATGLGLATVHGLVKQQCGWIEFQSEPGLGSSFNVFLPCAAGLAPRVQRSMAVDAERATVAT